MAKLTIATVCGEKYKQFLEEWKQQLPEWVDIIIETDDSNGIYEAKNKIVHRCKTEWLYMMDVDDIFAFYLKESWFNSMVEKQNADKVILGSDGRMLWQYLFKTEFIRECYDEVESVKKQLGIPILDIVSCEDMIITATNKWQTSKSAYLPVCWAQHTVNPVSQTSSKNYNLEKIKSLYRNFPNLVRVSKSLDWEFMQWIIMDQCKNQYWNMYRNFIGNSDEQKACDNYIANLYKEIE